MFTFIIPGARPSVLSALPSLVIHAALISGAVWGSKEVIQADPRPGEVIVLEWPTKTPTPGTPTAGTYTFPGPPVILPTEIPPIEDFPLLDPTRPVQFGDPTTLIPGEVPCTVDCESIVPITSASILSEREVDETPELRTAGALRYPAVLMQAGIEGSVVLSFVIDQEGRVEGEGIEVISASHQGFIAAAKDAVLSSRFTPARKHHEPVRVRVRQSVTFKR